MNGSESIAMSSKVYTCIFEVLARFGIASLLEIIGGYIKLLRNFELNFNFHQCLHVYQWKDIVEAVIYAPFYSPFLELKSLLV